MSVVLPASRSRPARFDVFAIKSLCFRERARGHSPRRAVELYDATVEYAPLRFDMIAVYDLHNCGMSEQAADFCDRMIPYMDRFEISFIAGLHNIGLHQQALNLYYFTVMFLPGGEDTFMIYDNLEGPAREVVNRILNA